MFKAFGNWFGQRTGLKKFIDLMLIEGIPGGAKWRYVWGSCLSFVFLVQVVTGVMLMTAYNPSAENAWRSVYFIQYEMDFGWFIRGLHHFGSQTMVVLLALHMLQVVIAGAHLPPREINWWLGLVLMGLVLGLSLTGYLLPWDQKGYYATRVATTIAEGVPVIGPQIKQIVLGGPEYGNATVSRFFALHVAILPGLLMVLMIAHIAVFRKQGVTHKKEDADKKKGWFWPDQAFRDLLVCLVIFGLMVFLVVNGHGHHVPPREPANGAEPGLYEKLATKGQEGMGANLDAPADRATAYPARPEWYFLFLFQLLKYFPGDLKVLGTVVIPGGIGLLLFLMPFLGSNKMGLASKIFGGFMLLLSLAGAGGLTYLAVTPGMLQPTEHALVTRILLGPAWMSVILFGLAFVVGKMKPFGHAFGVLVVMTLITAAASLTCLALADDTSPWIPLEDDATREMSHALLTRIALVLIPAVAGFWLLHLAIMPLIKQRVVRGMVQILSYAILLVGFLAIGAGIFVAMQPDAVPEQLQETKTKLEKKLKESIEQFEKADDGSKKDFKEAIKHAKDYQKELQVAEKAAERAIKLAWTQGVPPEGGMYLLRNDPKTRFKDIFLKNCATCHSYGELGNTKWKTTDLENFKDTKFTAPDLGGFGTKFWIHEFFKDMKGEELGPYFYGRAGKQRRRGYYFRGMATAVREYYEAAAAEAKQKNQSVEAAHQKVTDDLGKIAGWLAKHPTGTKWEGEYKVGFELFKGDRYRCHTCHQYEGVSKPGEGPDLTAYGSQKWLLRMLRSPDHESTYGTKNKMPAFRNWTGTLGKVMAEDYKARYFPAMDPKKQEQRLFQIRDIDREILIRHFTRDDRVVFGGQEITGAKKKEEE